MTDLQVLNDAIKSVQIPISEPSKLADNPDRSDEFAHTPYIDEYVRPVEYPESGE